MTTSTLVQVLHYLWTCERCGVVSALTSNPTTASGRPSRVVPVCGRGHRLQDMTFLGVAER